MTPVNDIWCMERGALARLESLLAAWDGKIPEARAEAKPRRQKHVAVMSLSGLLEPKASLMGMLFGGTSTEEFGAMFNSVMKDDRVGGVLIDVDSPGGTVEGTQELGDLIFAARGTKPIIAAVNHFAGSAALWIASAADRLVISPTGMAGSVGALVRRLDVSAALEANGIKKDVIVSKDSPFKAELDSSKPLTNEARDYLQGVVDEWGGQFVSALAKYRGISPDDVRKNFGKGRMLTARQAIKAGMVDRLGTFGETLGQMVSGRVRLGARACDDHWDYRHVQRLKRRAALAGI